MFPSASTIKTLVILILVLSVAGWVTYGIQQKAQRTTSQEASLVPEASSETPYTDLEGQPFSFDQFGGQVRVINSWASWCPFCVAELQDFEALAIEYKDQDVAVIAINRKETKEKASAFLKTVGTFSEVHFAVDLTDAFYKSIGGFSMPETVFYDTEGTIVLHKRGFMNLEEMRKHTQDALAASNK